MLLGTQNVSANENPLVVTEVTSDSTQSGENVAANEAVASEGTLAGADDNQTKNVSLPTLDNDQALKQKFNGISGDQFAQHPLGKAAIFHIFSNKVKIGADVNGNIATKELVNGPEFGTRSESHNFTSGDVYYIEHVDSIGANAFRTGNNYVVFGDDSNVEVKGNQVYVNGTRLDHLNANDYHAVKGYIDFDEEFNKLQQRATELANRKSSADVKADFETDMNNRYIDVSAAKDSIIVVKVPAQYIEAPQPITIKGLSSDDKGPVVVLDVDTDKDVINFNTQAKLSYSDGNTVSPNEGHNEPNHVLWNFGNKVNEINVNSGYLLGSVLAPNATFNTGVNVDGNIIADTVNINGGESHRWDLHVPDYFAVEPKDNGDQGETPSKDEKSPVLVPVTPQADNGEGPTEKPNSPAEDQDKQTSTTPSKSASDASSNANGSTTSASNTSNNSAKPADSNVPASSEAVKTNTSNKGKHNPYFPNWGLFGRPDNNGHSSTPKPETPTSEGLAAETPVHSTAQSKSATPGQPVIPATPANPSSEVPAKSATPKPVTPVVPTTPTSSATPAESVTVVEDTTMEENAASFNDDQAEQPVPTTTTASNKAQASVDSEKTVTVATSPAQAKASQSGLPQTGSAKENKLGVLGLTCAFVLSFVGLSKKKLNK